MDWFLHISNVLSRVCEALEPLIMLEYGHQSIDHRPSTEIYHSSASTAVLAKRSGCRSLGISKSANFSEPEAKITSQYNALPGNRLPRHKDTENQALLPPPVHTTPLSNLSNTESQSSLDIEKQKEIHSATIPKTANGTHNQTRKIWSLMKDSGPKLSFGKLRKLFYRRNASTSSQSPITLQQQKYQPLEHGGANSGTQRVEQSMSDYSKFPPIRSKSIDPARSTVNNHGYCTSIAKENASNSQCGSKGSMESESRNILSRTDASRSDQLNGRVRNCRFINQPREIRSASVYSPCFSKPHRQSRPVTITSYMPPVDTMHVMFLVLWEDFRCDIEIVKWKGPLFKKLRATFTFTDDCGVPRSLIVCFKVQTAKAESYAWSEVTAYLSKNNGQFENDCIPAYTEFLKTVEEKFIYRRGHPFS